MRRLLHAVRRGAELVAVGLFVTMFGAFLLQVFMRYVVNRPLEWTSEVAVILYIWLVFWTCAFLLRERDHVAFTIVYDSVSPAARRLLAILGAASLAAAFAAALPAVVDYVTFMRIDVTPVTRLRFDYVYSIWIVFAVSVVLRSLWRLAGLAGPNWPRETGDSPDPHPTIPAETD